jgi:hypothetical protein
LEARSTVCMISRQLELPTRRVVVDLVEDLCDSPLWTLLVALRMVENKRDYNKQTQVWQQKYSKTSRQVDPEGSEH